VLGRHVRATTLGYCATPEEKAELDAEITGVAERFRLIIDACVSEKSAPPREAERTRRYLAGICPAPGARGAEDMRVISLRMSVRHLAAEVEELTGIVGTFLGQT